MWKEKKLLGVWAERGSRKASRKATARVQEEMRVSGQGGCGCGESIFQLILKVKTPGFAEKSDTGHEN